MANIGADPEALAAARAAFLRTQRGAPGLTGAAAPILAPCCGRRADPDTVLDVRMVPGIAADFLCDACRHRLVADKRNDWTRSKLARAAGLGWPEVRGHRIRELMAEELRREGRIDRRASLARIHRELPDRDIPGTEAPPGVAHVPPRRRKEVKHGRHGIPGGAVKRDHPG